MTNKGIRPEAPHVPSRFGLFSVASVVNHAKSESSEQWVRGFSVDQNSRVKISIVDDADTGIFVVADETAASRFADRSAFFIQAEDEYSTLHIGDSDPIKIIENQLECATQKAIEAELWHGYAARSEANGNPYLTKMSTMTVLDGGVPASFPKALGLLERTFANLSALGEQGVIHMDRGIFAYLENLSAVERCTDADGREQLQTRNGTPIVVGSGYDGTGPVVSLDVVTVTSEVGVFSTNGGAPHYLTVGDYITIANAVTPGVDPDPDVSYDGTYIVTAVTTNTFTVAVPGAADVAAADLTDGVVQFTAEVTEAVGDLFGWVYMTNSVFVEVGAIAAVTETISQAYNVSGNQNDIHLVANRPAAVEFDPIIHLGIKVNG